MSPVTRRAALGAGAAFTDLIAGRVDLMYDNPGSSMVHVRSGRLKVLATTGLTRLTTLPDSPAIAESLPGFDALNWFILTAPAGTPAPLLERLNVGLAQAMRTDAMRQVLERDGLNAVANSRAEAAACAAGISSARAACQRRIACSWTASAAASKSARGAGSRSKWPCRSSPRTSVAESRSRAEHRHRVGM